MAKIVKKMLKKRDVTCSVEPPPLNLLNGKFRRKIRIRVAEEEEGYEGNYELHLRLINDDSPLQRIEVSLVNKRSKRAAGRYVMPVLFWELLESSLPDFMAEVKSELSRRGVPPSTYSAAARRRLMRGPNKD